MSIAPSPAHSCSLFFNCTYIKGRNDVSRFPRISRYGVTSAVTTAVPSPRPSGSAPTKRTLNVTAFLTASNSLLPSSFCLTPPGPAFSRYPLPAAPPWVRHPTNHDHTDEILRVLFPARTLIYARLRVSAAVPETAPSTPPTVRTRVRGSADAGRRGHTQAARLPECHAWPRRIRRHGVNGQGARRRYYSRRLHPRRRVRAYVRGSLTPPCNQRACIFLSARRF